MTQNWGKICRRGHQHVMWWYWLFHCQDKDISLRRQPKAAIVWDRSRHHHPMSPLESSHYQVWIASDYSRYDCHTFCSLIHLIYTLKTNLYYIHFVYRFGTFLVSGSLMWSHYPNSSNFPSSFQKLNSFSIEVFGKFPDYLTF